MAITPADIEQLTFSEAKRGYNTEEVDAFLERLCDEVDAMLQKIADLKGRLTTTEQQLAQAQAQLSEAPVAPVAPVAAPQPSMSSSELGATERQISQALIVAQQSAERIVADARETAEHIRNEADQKAREVIRVALAEKQNELDEIDRLKRSREEFRAEYKSLVQHFLDEVEAVFPDSVLMNSNTPSYTNSQPAPSADATVMAPMPEVQNQGVSVDDLD